MKRLFITSKKENLKRCFTEEQIGNSRMVSTEEFMKNPMDYQDVEYIFSTWGMPRFSEQEIRRYFPALKAVFYAAGSVGYFARPYLHWQCPDFQCLGCQCHSCGRVYGSANYIGQ